MLKPIALCNGCGLNTGEGGRRSNGLALLQSSNGVKVVEGWHSAHLPDILKCLHGLRCQR